MVESFKEHHWPVRCGGESDNDDWDFPTIRLTLKRLRRPWLYTLRIQLLGKKKGYNFQIKRLHQMWAPNGHIALRDLGNDFVLVRFTAVEDFYYVMKEGP